MIQYLLKSADFSGLFRFVSPNFFKVVSPKIVFQIAAQIKSNQADQRRWDQVCASYAPQLSRAALGVELERSKFPKSVDSTLTGLKLDSRDLGHRTLALFFHQVFTQDVWVIDLRSDAFEVTAGDLLWKPKAYYFCVEPSFLEAVRSLYRGFYSWDEAQFDEALRDLRMEGARESLRAHFGWGDQSAVVFQLKTFQDTFAQVFEACARSGTQVKGDFFVLGLMLLGLYERLETLGGAFDVRSSFDSAIAAVATNGSVT